MKIKSEYSESYQRRVLAELQKRVKNAKVTSVTYEGDGKWIIQTRCFEKLEQPRGEFAPFVRVRDYSFRSKITLTTPADLLAHIDEFAQIVINTIEGERARATEFALEYQRNQNAAKMNPEVHDN